MPNGLQNLNETNEPYFEISNMNEQFPINQLYFCVTKNPKSYQFKQKETLGSGHGGLVCLIASLQKFDA